MVVVRCLNLVTSDPGLYGLGSCSVHVFVSRVCVCVCVLATEAGQKRRKEDMPVFEQAENVDNPLRCPVKLYEFYLSKWCVCLCVALFFLLSFWKSLNLTPSLSRS